MQQGGFDWSICTGAEHNGSVYCQIEEVKAGTHMIVFDEATDEKCCVGRYDAVLHVLACCMQNCKGDKKR